MGTQGGKAGATLPYCRYPTVGSEGKVGRQAWQAGSSDIHSMVPNVNNEQMRAQSYVLNVSPT